MNVAGPDVLKAAVDTLRDEISIDAGDGDRAAPPVPPPRREVAPSADGG
jgi:hypothetical protein